MAKFKLTHKREWIVEADTREDALQRVERAITPRRLKFFSTDDATAPSSILVESAADGAVVSAVIEF